MKLFGLAHLPPVTANVGWNISHGFFRPEFIPHLLPRQPGYDADTKVFQMVLDDLEKQAKSSGVNYTTLGSGTLMMGYNNLFSIPVIAILGGDITNHLLLELAETITHSQNFVRYQLKGALC